MTLFVPFGYGDDYRDIDWLADWLLEHHHPEYVRRLVAWLESKNGVIGVGGGWRDDGSQPDEPGFAPEGKSFHQNQAYADGFVGACAVDVVKANPSGGAHVTVAWSDVPNQGSPDAATWGIHANVNAGPTPEAWHIQPVEIDGWDTWGDAGCPAPQPNYPLPGTEEDVTDDDIERIAKRAAQLVWQTQIKVSGKPDPANIASVIGWTYAAVTSNPTSAKAAAQAPDAL